MAKNTFKSSIHRFRALSIACLACVVSSSVPALGEEPPITPPTPLPEKPAISLKALDEDFPFDPNNRRDPFTFIKSIAEIPGQVDNSGVVTTAVDAGKLPPEVVEQKRNAAELACNMAEASLMDLEPNVAISRCEQGMEVFKDVPDISRYPELEVVKGRLMRARKASDQMRSRQTAERDFNAMNLKIAGVTVVGRNSKSSAIINSKTLHKGDLVAISSDSSDLMVDEIMPERVVFVYRGYRMSLLLAPGMGQ